jgi:hypothetical protein
MIKEKDKKDDKKWEIDCLANDIRRVEKAKLENPEMYNEAVRKLKGESKAISSLEELKEKGARLAEKEVGYDRDE